MGGEYFHVFVLLSSKNARAVGAALRNVQAPSAVSPGNRSASVASQIIRACAPDSSTYNAKIFGFE